LKTPETELSFRTLPRRQVIVTFVGVLLAIFLSTMDQTIVATAMPDIIADLGGFAHYTFVTTAYLVTSTVAIPITGRLTDIYGRKWFYTGGIIIFIIGSLLSGLSQTLNQLIIFRAFQGIGAGVMIANAFATVGDLFPPSVRGKYQGYISGVFGLSSVIGPTLGGFITDNFSWHWIFYINIPIGIGVIALFITSFPLIRPRKEQNAIDYKGIVLLILTVVPLLLALSWGGVQYPWVSVEIIGMLVFSLIMGILLIIIDNRIQHPILPLQYFADRTVSISMAVTLLSGFGMFGAILFIPLYFQGVRGFSASASGNSLTPLLLGLVAGSLGAGQLMSRAGGHYRRLGIAGTAVMAVGLGLLATLNINTSTLAVILFSIVTGIGLGVTFPIYTIAAQNAVPHKVMGAVVSSIPFSRFIGGTLGLAIMGSILSRNFTAGFIKQLPPQVKSSISPDQISALAQNPQALISPQAQAQLQSLLTSLGAQSDLNQIVLALRESLVSAIAGVLLIACAVMVVAFVVNLFIKEIPLRKQQGMPNE
jgi:EmrB/QacA subfamily drug resistance transporter